ncbi:MAG: diphosphomevalonate decarboxylase [Pseudobdellovibrio sp.]
MRIEASAPSNIALIKYMGKVDSKKNSPCNSSLSYTLNHLRTFVSIEDNVSLEFDSWSSLDRKDLRRIDLSEKGRNKFLKHFSFLKEQLNISEKFEIKSANNFPSDCGLASSASSFAALTLAAYQWALQAKKISIKDDGELAMLSKMGSGSSCRSFYSPWVVWDAEGVKQIELAENKLKHQVVLCDESIKSVSSSDAHLRVLTSDLFIGRPARAELRLNKLKEVLSSGKLIDSWRQAFEICWNEFWDMHALFHTSQPAFMYMNSGSQEVLTTILKIWNMENDGPLVTMDAGSNIHLLYRKDQDELYSRLIKLFSTKYSVWTDEGYVAKV